MSGIVVAIPLIQDVNATIAGIRTAPALDSYPNRLVSNGSPWCLTFAGDGLTGDKGPDFYESRRFFITEVYRVPASHGAPMKERNLTEALMDDFVTAWFNRINGNEDWVLDYGASSGYRVQLDRTREIRDSGPTAEMVYDSEQNKWWGFQLAIPFLIQWGDAIC